MTACEERLPPLAPLAVRDRWSAARLVWLEEIEAPRSAVDAERAYLRRLRSALWESRGAEFARRKACG